MPGIDTPKASRSIENLMTLNRVVMHVLGTDKHTWIFLELAVCRERHPERAEIIRRWIIGIRHGGTPVSDGARD
jgi:hypothetical protein